MPPVPWERLGRRGFMDYLQAQSVTDRQLAAILRDAAIQADRLVASTIGDGIGAQVRRAQYAQASSALRNQQAALWDSIGDSTRAGIERATTQSVKAQARLVEFLVRAQAVEGIPATMLLDSFPAAAQRAAEVVKSRVIARIDFSPRVYRNRDIAANRIDRVVNRGIAIGKSAREIASDVKYLIRPDTPGGVSYAAKRLARTEINNAWHATNVQSYNNSPFVDAVRWELSASHPRPDVCNEFAELDDERLGPGVYSPRNVPAKPHPQCLCFTAPITVSPQRFADTLLSGGYDNWLIANGQSPMGFGGAAGALG